MNIQKPKIIMLVEDEEVISLIEKKLLEAYGYEIILAGTGEEAINAVNNNDIDLILMDIDLGSGIDGTETASLILKEHDIPVVFLSNHTEPEIVAKTEKITSYGYVVKNSGITVLDAAIKMALKLFDAKISERQKEHALLESEKKYRAIIEASPVPYALNDENLNITYLNNSFIQTFGYTIEDIPTLEHWWPRAYPDEEYRRWVSSAWQARVDKVKREGTAFEPLEIIICCKNGTKRNVIASAASLEESLKGVHLVILYDITEIKRIDESLREAHQLNEQIINSVQEGIIVYGPDLRYRVWNPFMEQMSGVPAGEVLGKRPLEVFPFLKNTGVIERLDKALAGETVDPVDFPFNVSAIGKSGWNTDYSAPLRNTRGDIIGVIGTVFDITERKRIEEEKNKATERLGFAQRSARVGVWDWDMISGKLNWTPELYYIFGLDPNTATADFETWRNIVHPLDREIAESGILNAVRDHIRLENEYRIILSSGDVRWIGVFGDTTYDVDNKPLRMAGICLDITEQKRNAEIMTENRQRINFHVENSPLAIIEWDKNYLVTQWSGESEKIFGWKAEETLGKPIMDLKMIYEEDVSKVQETMKLLSGGKLKHVISFNRNYTKDRKVIHCEWYNSILNDQNGEMISVMSQVLDVTDRRNDEEKIKNLLAEKELLLKEVHHRIKNNMNTVVGLLSLQIDSLNEPSAIAALNDARSRVQSIMLLYDKLHRSNDYRKISFKEYILPLIDEIIGNFPNSNAAIIEKNIDDFMIDAKKISQIGIIINELFTNIMKHAFAGVGNGIIKLSAAAIENHVTITIHDNGIGISESIDIKNSGGFGLKLVNMMVKQLRGSIKFERENGTKFILEFDL